MSIKKTSPIYFLLTSIIMILPPLCFGLTAIYFVTMSSKEVYLIGLIMNYLFMLFIGVIGLILWLNKKIVRTSVKDVKLLIFGILANLIIYLFVFQDSLKITDLIDIYISTIIILVLYFILVNSKFINWELTIQSILFFSLYRFHMGFVYAKQGGIPIISGKPIIYFIVPLLTLGIYLYKLYLYKVFDWFSGIFSVLTALSLMVLFDLNENFVKILFTIYLIMPFVFIIDLVVTRFKASNKLPFYLRITTIAIMIAIFKPWFEIASFKNEGMYQFTFIMYASILINIIENFKLTKKESKLEINAYNLITDGLVKVGDLFETNQKLFKVVDVIEENMILRNVENLSEIIIIWSVDFPSLKKVNI